MTTITAGRSKIGILENLPVLSHVLKISKEDGACDCASSYNNFVIKAHGSRKFRTICAPCPHLKLVQRTLLEKLLAPVVAHSSAMAFVRGKSIAMNARCHHGASNLFKTDIRSFFSSVKLAHVEEMLIERFPHLSRLACDEIVGLVTRDGQLPQGAPTSPHIANLVMFSADETFREAADRYGAVYTRYADDISVSSNDADSLRHIENIIRMGLDALRMEIHPEKTRHLGPNQTKLVTGLDIGGSRVRPTRAFRKKAAALVRMSEKYPSKMERHHDMICGYLAFWYDVDPVDPQLADLLDRMARPRWAAKVRQAGREC